jgi:acyl dehydratase
VGSAETLKERIGHELALGAWFVVSQDRINSFAACTEDWQFIHVDSERAARSSLGGTIAHGFLTLSMLGAMCQETFSRLKQHVIGLDAVGLNYGIDKVRFLRPVHAGKRIRAHTKLLDLREKATGRMVVSFGVAVEIEGEEKPALVAEWLVMWIWEASALEQRATA